MARVKSGFRKRFNIRYWRWQATRATIGRISALRRRFSFYPGVVHPARAASVVLEDRSFDLPTLFTPAETDFVRDRCWSYDTLALDWPGGPTARARQIAVTIGGAEFLGHVGVILAPAQQAVVMLHEGTANWNFAKARTLRQDLPIAGRCHFLARTDNYYHALFHDLVPLVDYLERLHPKGLPLTLVCTPSRLAILRQACSMLETAYPGLRTVELAEDAKVPVEEALWLSMQAGNAEWNVADAAPVQRMADIFRGHYGVRAGRGRRLFFSRGGSKIRRLINEEVLFEIAKAHGFERFEARADNHAEQVQAFSDADIVVGVHGAGLGNLAFCKPGTKMLEIFPENFTKSTYLWVSRHVGLEYDWIVGGAGDYDQAFSLDETAFRRKLEELLARASAPA
jgi:Glycosyltransferase 61